MELIGLKVLAIFVVLVCGMIGPTVPVLFAFCSRDGRATDRKIQKVIKVMTIASIGIVLATALIHMLPEGMEHLKESNVAIFSQGSHDHDEQHNPCDNSSSSGNSSGGGNHSHDDDDDDNGEHHHGYPFGTLFCMCGIAAVYIISTEINFYGARKLRELKGVDSDEAEEERQAALIKLYILEVGVAVHSIIIGLTMGVTTSRSEASTLFIVLCVHQSFEGLAIGSLAVMAQTTFRQAAGFVIVFALTTPFGICLGIGISGNQSEVVQGILSVTSAGILLHMALVEMLPHVFGHGGSSGGHSHAPLPIDQLQEKLNQNNNNENNGEEENENKKGEQNQKKGGNEDSSLLASQPEQYGSLENNNNQKKGKEQQQQEEENSQQNKKFTPMESSGTTVACGDEQDGIYEGDREDFDEGNGGGGFKKRRFSSSSNARRSLTANSTGGGGTRRRTGSVVAIITRNSVNEKNQRTSEYIEGNRQSLISTYMDDHEDDEDLPFRVLCYFMFILGGAGQAVLGMFA